MTSTHTPAPWHYETGDDGAVIYTGFTIAKIPIDGSDWQSNAHLIAVAPDLLAALSGIFGHAERTDAADLAELWGRMDDIRNLARAAISKATGGAA
jgi:lipopolysaccharide biosynthesis protein